MSEYGVDLHNLAEVPEFAAISSKMEAAVLKFLMEGSDFVPWQRDPRFPVVDLPSPLEQWNARSNALKMQQQQ